MTLFQSIICMHLVAALWGMAGVLGALSSLDSGLIVTLRAAIGILTILIFYKPAVVLQNLYNIRHLWKGLFLAGALLGVHWIFFFRCISHSGVALALLTYSCAPIIVAFMEVLLGWSKLKYTTLFAALLCWTGIWLIHPIYSLADIQSYGLLYGILSAIAIAVMGLLAKRLIAAKADPIALSLSQLFGAMCTASPLALAKLKDSQFRLSDVFVVLALGIFCSALGQTLFNRALSQVRASTASIIATMETPYGVILALLVNMQSFSWSLALGTALVTLAALSISRSEVQEDKPRELPLNAPQSFSPQA